jgi:hypothetical protein
MEPLGRVQEDEPSASFGSEILSVRIAALHQRISSASACVAICSCGAMSQDYYRGPNALSEHGLFDVLVRTVTWLHCERITSRTSKSYLRVTILLGVAADQRSRL